MEKYKIVSKILIPFIVALVIVSAVSMFGMYILQKKLIDKRATDQFEDVSSFLYDTVESDAKLFMDLIRLLQHDERSSALFKNKERDRLYEHLTQRYSELNRQYGINHFSFHNVDKTNFLRLHDKERHSDTVGWEIFGKAVQSGATASGIEFGINNHLTLRVVSPWYENGKLIGYVELGKDIDRLTPELSKKFEADIIVTLKKEAIRDVNYSQLSKNNFQPKLDHYYMIDSTLQTIEPQLRAVLDNGLSIANLQVKNAERSFCLNSRDLTDNTGKNIGNIYVLIDITDELNNLNTEILKVASLMSVVILLLIYYYYALINNIDKKMRDSTDKIGMNYRFEKYVNQISNDLLTSRDFDHSILNTLQILGESLDADRSFLVRFEEGYSKMVNTHEWCAEGIPSKKQELQNISTDGIWWWVKQFRDLKPIILEKLDDLPPEAQKEKKYLADLNIKSLLTYPVISHGRAIGFVGVEISEKSVKWSETHYSFVKITSEIISSAYDKKIARDQLVMAYDSVSLILKTASNGILAVDENNKIMFYNKMLLEIWGIDKLDDSVDSLEKIFQSVSFMFSEKERYFSELELFLQNREIKRNYTFCLKDKRTIESTVIPIFKDKVFKGNSFSFRDITQQVSYENELKLSQKVFDNSLEGILITDENTNIIKVNDAFKRLTGYSDEEIFGKNPTLLRSNWHDDEFYRQMWEKLCREGIWEGEIKDRRKSGEFYIGYLSIIRINDSEGKVSNYIGITRDITQMKENEKQMQILAFYDPLTNLPNRTLFHDRLGQSILDAHRNGTKMALLFIDLDRFKSVNDTYGHHVGDVLLQNVAVMLKESVRENDIVSRLGGDEFTIILKQIGEREDIALVAREIIQKLTEPIMVEQISLNVGTSIGAAIYPDDSEDKDQLIQMADSAMYKAKENGKNRLEFF